MAFTALLLNFCMPFYEWTGHYHAFEYILCVSRTFEHTQTDKDYYPTGQSTHSLSLSLSVQMYGDDVDDCRGNQEEEYGQVQQVPERK